MNKLMIGKGNLAKFAQDYEKTTTVNKGRMWSTCYPTTELNTADPEFKMVYEYVIGYEVLDTPDTKQLNLTTGTVQQTPEPPKKLLIM